MYDKHKYHLLLPKYRKVLLNMRERRLNEEDAYTSDLEIDLTEDKTFNKQEMQATF